MKTDVFLCHLGKNDDWMRAGMFLLTSSRWTSEPDTRLHDMTPFRCNCTPEEFQRERRICADIAAESDIYVVADDDCLPRAEPFVEYALKVMGEHPEFAILSLLPTNARIMRWRPQDYETYEHEDVTEHVSVGGIRFCRKGILEEWPEMTGKGYDREHGDAIRDAGYRVGYFRHLTMNHLGEGYSTVWT
ncbi:MAG: hypothetical protein ACYTG5_19395 [Planctomycetota bacterium]|jgi:hypothetical protein